jgi:hypothetical protein
MSFFALGSSVHLGKNEPEIMAGGKLKNGLLLASKPRAIVMSSPKTPSGWLWGRWITSDVLDGPMVPMAKRRTRKDIVAPSLDHTANKDATFWKQQLQIEKIIIQHIEVRNAQLQVMNFFYGDEHSLYQPWVACKAI